MKTAARTIRDETGEGRNTAYRVGSLLLELAGAIAQGGGGTVVYGIAATRAADSVSIYLLDADGNELKGPSGQPLSVKIPSADSLGAGFMSKADKEKLDQLEAGGGTTYEVFSVGKAGLVPAPGSSAYTRFLRSDGIWVNPQPVLAFGGVVSGVTVSQTSVTTSGFAIVYDKDNDRFLKRYGALTGSYTYYLFNTDNWRSTSLGRTARPSSGSSTAARWTTACTSAWAASCGASPRRPCEPAAPSPHTLPLILFLLSTPLNPTNNHGT